MTPHPLRLLDSPTNPVLAAIDRPGKDTVSRLRRFGAWLHATGGDWLAPDLNAYRDHLLATPTRRTGAPLQPASVAAHLATIRGAYAALLADNAARRQLYALLDPDLSLADQKAAVDEALTRLHNATGPRAGAVPVTQRQDVEDSAGRRLTVRQANALLQSPGLDTLKGLRDTAMIALLLCTGIREAELCALDVPDLRQQLGGALALRVRHGKGDKQRLIPYGDLDWALVLVAKWLVLAGIRDYGRTGVSRAVQGRAAAASGHQAAGAAGRRADARGVPHPHRRHGHPGHPARPAPDVCAAAV